MAKAIFLDMDGVLVDSELLPSEYLRLMGDVLVPALGGSNEDWAAANRIVFAELLPKFKSGSWPTDPPCERTASVQAERPAHVRLPRHRATK